MGPKYRPLEGALLNVVFRLSHTRNRPIGVPQPPYRAYTCMVRTPEGSVLRGPLKGTNKRVPIRGTDKWAHMDPKGDPYMGPFIVLFRASNYYVRC